MLLITCPLCGPRDEIEFQFAGPAQLPRPEPYDRVTDEHWADYLYYRDNPKGMNEERWLHAFGCRRWLVVVRSTIDHSIASTRPLIAQAVAP